MMNYCFWYGGSKPSDLEWLGNAFRLLKENKWDGQSTLYFDGSGWGEKIREEAAISLLQALKTCKSVKSLYLRKALLDVKAETALTQVFETNEYLERIVLRGIETNSGILQLPECIFKNPSLREFDFTKGLICSASLVALSAVLLNPDNSLTHLSLDNVVIDGCFKSFAEGIAKSKLLRFLVLKNMRLSGEQMALLLNALGENQSITSLTMENLNLGTSQIDKIATMLTTNKHLQEISLRRNAIDGEAAGALFRDTSAWNEALRSLLLSQNPLGDQGARAITAFLQSNTSLETLCLTDCKMGVVGCRAIAKGLSSMKGIRRLFLDSNKMEHSASLVLASLQKGNYTLTDISQRLPTLSYKQTATWEQIEMHLRWNQCGRRFLRGEQEDLFLSNILHKVNSDPDLLYAFLRDSSVVC